ncbi:serine/threonine protein kinase with PASTA sensor(S) [Clostridium sp. CAG:343]|jgi:serine/threonine protein kinase|nr:serine/threonine protein kinase with PASTA sensor(S) [Clostridium sp. CAG:343]HCF34452.1 Stk1 family PASTA domain-containing Ser/Thr kinase [Clostridiales bacterium]
MNLEGKLLGNRYEIIEKIGNGGMATVYKATDKVLKRNVAVKILRDEFTTDDEFIKRFEVEAQSAARLTHPNIVSIYDVGVDGNLYYIVMELIQGKTLKEIIVKEKGPLPWKWSINVSIQIASALEMAHRNNIIHRDIKPHNIIITEDGVAKVTDFGIAKAVSNSTITAFGTTIGSVHYFSPEHARGGFTDAKSDLYSLGVVMYEMVTGRVPFDADTPVSVALKHMQEEPVEPIELNPNLPIAVNKIIMRALQKDTTLRYQTASEMLVDLKKSLKDPEGDFVEELEYDPTAKTQVIDTNAYRDNKQTKNSSGKKDGKFKTFVKTHKGLSIFIGLLLLFVLSLGGTMLVLNLTNPPEIAMPNVVGLSKEEAQKEIENVKLKFEIEKEEYNKDVPEGFIISQDPTYMEKFNKVKQGSTVKVVVSKGEEKTTVPKVVGMEKDKAVKALEDAKLKVEIVEESSKKVQEGYVISQETSPDTEAFAGDTIKIHVSTGVEKATVPDVIGKSQADAKKTLEAQGFVVAVTTSEDSSKENGIVLKQSLDSGKTVEKGSTVTITVNSYEASKTMSVNINVKAITGGYSEETSNSNTTENKTVKTVSITLKSGNNTLYSDSGVDKNTTSKSTTISGKGSMDLTLTITDSNGGSWTRTKSVNFSTDSSVNFN